MVVSRAVLSRWFGVVLAVVVVAAVVLTSRDDSDPEGDSTEATALEVTSSEQETFRDLCEANAVSEARCECALERSIGQLEPAVFREGLSLMLAEDGALTDEFVEVFQSCIEDGF